MDIKNIVFLVLVPLLFACNNQSSKTGDGQTKSVKDEVTVYTHRHYDTDQKLFEQFEEQTGIEVNVVNAHADELIQKMIREGKQSPADVLITVDAGRLVRAKEKGLLQPVSSDTLEKAIPSHLKDPENHWFGLTKRARVIVYDKDELDPDELSTYENLTHEKWKNRILIRSSGNIYNQSLLASLIAHHDEAYARKWAEGMVANFARTPKGNDRDQVKAVLAGVGDIAIINTYYLGKMLNSENPEEVQAGKNVEIFFPNQNGRGTHINVSGAGIAKNAPHKENAKKFLEYLVSPEVQEDFASSNYEYPVNPNAKLSELLKSWGTFKEDTLSLSKLGELNQNAVVIFDQAGWK